MALEVSFYLDHFHNLDLWQQGWYAIKLSCAWEGAERGAGVPSRVVQYEAGENGTDGLATIWHINDTDDSFCTRPFRVKYARQDVLLSVIVSFSLSISSTEKMRNSSVIIKSELLFAPLDGFLIFNSMHLELPSVSQSMYRLPSRLLHGFHGYCRLQFDSKHMALVDLFVHTVVLGLSHHVGVEEIKDSGVQALLLDSRKALAAQLARIQHEDQNASESDEAKLSTLWNLFLSLHRENRATICNHLHALWLEGRQSECSMWVIHSQRSIAEDGQLKSSKKMDDPASTSCTRAEMYRRGLMQSQAGADSLQDMQIFGRPSRQPIVFLEQETFTSDLPVEASSSSRKTTSVVVFVHGFQGHHLDLRLIRNNWLLADPNAEFVMSEANEEDTSGELGEMGLRLADEVATFLTRKFIALKKRKFKLSFVGHSIGNLIIRAALTHPSMQPHLEHLHTFLSISGPHLGYMYSSNLLFNSGLWVLKKFKASACMHQLTFTDSANIEDCFIFKLSQAKTFEHFRHVLLLSSPQDRYVPYHSARIESCAAAVRDASRRGASFLTMLRNCEEQLKCSSRSSSSSRTRSLIRCDVNFDTSSLPRTSFNTIIGRRAHIEFLETDVFIRFVMWSLPSCFNPASD